MDYQAEFDRALRIVKLDRAAMLEVADDEEAFVPGLGIVAIGGLLGWLIMAFPIGIVAGPIAAIVYTFIGVGLWYLMGSFLSLENWDFMRLFRAVAYGSLVSWASVIPFVGVLTGLWQLVLTVVIVQELGRTTTGKAVAVVLVPAAVCCVIGGILSMMFGAAMMAALGAHQ